MSYYLRMGMDTTLTIKWSYRSDMGNLTVLNGSPILAEINAEVRRALIQGIGYDRICQELQAGKVDVWGDYTSLRLNVTSNTENP